MPALAPPGSAGLLIELESQQDDLLRQLDNLNQRIEQAIVAGQMQVRAGDPQGTRRGKPVLAHSE